MKKIFFCILLITCLYLLYFVWKRDLTPYFALPKDKQTIDALINCSKNTIITVVSIVLGFLLSFIPQLINKNKESIVENYSKYYGYDIILDYLNDNDDAILQKLCQRIKQDEKLFKYNTWLSLLNFSLRKLSYKDKIIQIRDLINRCNEIAKKTYSTYKISCNNCNSALDDITLADYGTEKVRSVRCTQCKSLYHVYITTNNKIRLKQYCDKAIFKINTNNWDTKLKIFLEVQGDIYLNKIEFLHIAKAMKYEISQNHEITSSVLVKSLRNLHQIIDLIRDPQLIQNFISLCNRAGFYSMIIDEKVKYMTDKVTYENIALSYLYGCASLLMNFKVYLSYNDIIKLNSLLIPDEIKLTNNDYDFLCDKLGIKT